MLMKAGLLSMSLKVNTGYMSRYSGREFKWDGEQVWTRLRRYLAAGGWLASTAVYDA
ncbi:hypothetical protein KMB89_gp01 [Citrobacter phage HCF1]|uniref:Uncharacterized protein n=1 Tax=Citrobacter phage HCF1 TaxID=2849700 RepID=A0ABX6D3H4_9CAUD|nr:hypothetical protein KMB89_gp01 [Citrobacter phage HCF1]